MRVIRKYGGSCKRIAYLIDGKAETGTCGIRQRQVQQGHALGSEFAHSMGELVFGEFVRKT